MREGRIELGRAAQHRQHRGVQPRTHGAPILHERPLCRGSARRPADKDHAKRRRDRADLAVGHLRARKRACRISFTASTAAAIACSRPNPSRCSSGKAPTPAGESAECAPCPMAATGHNIRRRATTRTSLQYHQPSSAPTGPTTPCCCRTARFPVAHAATPNRSTLGTAVRLSAPDLRHDGHVLRRHPAQIDQANAQDLRRGCNNQWSDQDYAAARATGQARRLTESLPATETLATMAQALAGGGDQWINLFQGYHRLLQYCEHTNAKAAHGVRHPPAAT